LRRFAVVFLCFLLSNIYLGAAGISGAGADTLAGPTIDRLAAASSATVFARTSYGSPANSIKENGSWWFRDGYPYPGNQGGWGFTSDSSVGANHPGNCYENSDNSGVCFRVGDSNGTEVPEPIKVKKYCTWDGTGTFDLSQASGGGGGVAYTCTNYGYGTAETYCWRENWCPIYWYKLVDSFKYVWQNGLDDFVKAGGTLAGVESYDGYRAFFSSDNPTYYPSGPQSDVPLDQIYNNGWSLCWVGRYSDSRTSVSEISTACNQKYVIMAGSSTDPHLLNMPEGELALSGIQRVNQELKLETSSWIPDAAMTYQWLRDGSAILGATSSSYTLTPADYLKKISVQTKVSKPGYVSLTKASEDILVTAGSLNQTGTPSISGNSAVSTLVSASTGTWDPGVSFTYQWLRDGAPIASATSNTYLLAPDDYSRQISVQVTGSLSGFNPVTKTSNPVSVAAGTTTGLSRPAISGSGSAGSTLSISSPNEGYSASYQWLRDGVATGVSGSNYLVGLSDLGTTISAIGTFTKFGFEDASVSSTGFAVSNNVANTPCSASVDKSSWLSSSSQQPTISGSGMFGSSLQGVFGSWASGTKFCSYWFSNGQAIAGALGTTYKIQTADIGQQLQFVVIGTDKSGKSVLRYSKPVTIANSQFSKPNKPALVGQTRVGSKLTASVKPWSSNSTYSYQWLRNGNPILEATSSTYTLSNDDLGQVISLEVCGSRQYFETLCLRSSATPTIGLGLIPTPPASKILGNSAKVGSTLTGVTGNWMPGVTLQSQWLSDGKPISNATESSYVIQNSDRGHTLTYQVTASASGYQSVVKVSPSKKIP